MRRFLVLLGIVGLLAGVAASSVAATPLEVKGHIGGQAQFISPTTLELAVTYVCPETFGTANIGVSVIQSETGAQGFGPALAPCTGQAETVVVTVSGSGLPPTFVVGKAIATVFVAAGGVQGDADTRRIHIVL